MGIRLFSVVTFLAALGCAAHHDHPGDAAVTDGPPTDGASDASTTICDFLITDAAPCPDDSLPIYGLVLDATAPCVDRFSPREIVWCATRGRITSFMGDCYVLPDGTRVDVQWTPLNEPSDEYCDLPVCPP